MIEITKNLYQGDINDAIRVSQTKEVDAIVYLGQELPRQLSHESLIPIAHFPLKDGDGNFELSIHLILGHIGYLTLEDKTLIACRAGISRSPTIVVAYLNVYSFNECSFEKALKLMHKLNKAFQPEQKFLKHVKKIADSYWSDSK